MTPQELAYYQQQQQEQEGGLLDFLGKAALAAGAVAGGIAGARYLRGRTSQQPQRRAPAQNYEAVRRVAATQMPENPAVTRSQTPPSPGANSERIRRMEQITREARAERMPGVIKTDLSAAVRQAGSPAAALGVVPVTAASVRPLQGNVVTNLKELQATRGIPLENDPELISLVRQQQVEDALEEQRFIDQENRRQLRSVQGVESKEKALAKNILASNRAEAQSVQQSTQDPTVFLQTTLEKSGYIPTKTEAQQAVTPAVSAQSVLAADSAASQERGRVKAALQRNEDIPLGVVDDLEEYAGTNAAMREMADPTQMIGYEPHPDEAINTVARSLPDGLPADQAEGLNVLDLRNRKSFRIGPRALSQEEGESNIFREAQQYLRGLEVDTDFDYSAENKRQAAQVQDRIQRAQELKNQAEQILAEIRGEVQPQTSQLSPEAFAKNFNQQYREEINPALKEVDNARQRAELRASQAKAAGEDLESLLLGESSPVETTIGGKTLRGGKINAAGDIVYQDASGTYASADTGLKIRQAQGEQFAERARLLNKLSSASDEDLTYLVLQGQQARLNKQAISQLDSDTYRFASEVLRGRALKNPEPTRLQLDALDRARSSVAASQQVMQELRNQRPTLPPGPQQDVARAMETLRQGMVVEPSEPIPQYPSVQQLRTGYVSDEEIGPILGAADVYTGAAAEAAGPVIFTGKSKANSVLSTPPITGSVRTSTGRYLTQNNPDVLGTVYNVAGTPANRAISAQIEQNAQDFLQDAIAGGLQQKAMRTPEPFVTPARLPGPVRPPVQGPSLPPLGLTGIDPSKRTLYAQYQHGRSVPVPLSPFIGELAGGTVVVVPPTGTSTQPRRDIGSPSASIDLTRRGEKSRYYSDDPAYSTFTTGMEPSPIGPLTQSPGLSRIGGWTEQVITGAGGLPIIQQTTQGQKIAYPRMAKSITVPGYGGSVVTNIPRYGIDPGAEDWREDLMRSAYRRGGPVRTYQG